MQSPGNRGGAAQQGWGQSHSRGPDPVFSRETLWLQFLPDAENLCGLTFPIDPLGSLLLPFVFNDTSVGQGLVSGDVGADEQLCQAGDEQVWM